MEQKEKISEILIVAGLVGFAFFRYTKMSETEKLSMKQSIKETGSRIIKESIRKQSKRLFPGMIKSA